MMGIIINLNISLIYKKNKWAYDNLNLLIRIREEYLPTLPTNDKLVIIHQKDSSKESCIDSAKKILDILNISQSDLDYKNIIVDGKVRNPDIDISISSSWSKNNKEDISVALKTHKYLWICNRCSSEYLCEFRHRLVKDRCPFCSSQKINNSNCLYNTHRYLADCIVSDSETDANNITYGTSKKLRFKFGDRIYNTTPRNFNRLFNSRRKAT